jgi:hypothetical protein
MGRQLAPVRRAQELLLTGATMQSMIAELEADFGVSPTDAIAAIVVGRSLPRARRELPLTSSSGGARREFSVRSGAASGAPSRALRSRAGHR